MKQLSDSEFAERFWSRVDRRGECWLWTGTKHPQGYGMVTRQRVTRKAHRIAWELTHGPIPAGEGFHGTCVLHRCDNPTCCNPSHLFLGTQQDNIADMTAKGRHGHGSKQECRKGHPFDEANTMVYGNHRMCRICHRETSRKTMRRRRTLAA